MKDTSLENIKRRFTYSEIQRITKNFEKIVGKGGFGTVYHGNIGDTQVAVKMLSATSVQGYQEFQTEASNTKHISYHLYLRELHFLRNDNPIPYNFLKKGF